jgi:NAD+ kinase
MHVVGLMLHPERDCGGAVASVLDWADQRGIEVIGLDSELSRLACSANPVSPEELQQRADLLVSMGGDGTMLRAMRLADRQRFPVLGVNLGKLGFLAEVDVPDLPEALSAIDAHSYTTEPRLAVDATIGDRVITAFNDIACVRFPGHKTASVAVRAAGHPFVSYAADAIVVATPTGSTAYSFSAGGPIVSPALECLVVTPVAPHSAYNRGLVLSAGDQLALEILRGSGRLVVEADGIASADVGPGDRIELTPRPGAARVVRLGRKTFYQRAQRKLRLTDSAEIPATFGDGEEIPEHAAAVRDLPARPPRQRAALAPVAHRGELRRVPAAPAGARRARARRRVRTGHDHRGPGRPGAVRPGDRHRHGCRRGHGGAAGGRAPGAGQRAIRDRGRVPAGLRGRHVRRGARAPGAAAPVRPGRRAGRDAAGVPPGRRGRRPRR